MGSAALMVRPTWIAASRDEGQEANAGQHQVVIPKVDPLLQRLRSGLTAKPSTGGCHKLNSRLDVKRKPTERGGGLQLVKSLEV